MRKLWTTAVAHPLLALVLVGGLVGAAITITYTTDSTVTTDVTPAPVQYLAGDDAGPSTLGDYVSAYAISTNKTYITSTVKGVPEAKLTVGSYFKLDNVDDTSKSVTLSTSQVSNAKVTAYTIKIYNAADVLQGTLDLKAASPSTGAMTIPAHGDVNEPFYATLELTLATGTSSSDLGGGLSSAIALTVS